MSILSTKIIACLLLIIPFSGYTHAGKAAMVSDLEAIRHGFSVEYAPADWKFQFSGWELDNAIQTIKEEVLTNPHITVRDYQCLVKKFFRSTHDYHVVPFFYSTEEARLPFTVKGAYDRFFIIDIDKERLSPQQFPIEIGDELISFGGKPALDVIANLQLEEFGTQCCGTDRSLTEIFLTKREARRGHLVPTGAVEIVVKSPLRDEVSTFELQWDYAPEKIVSNFGDFEDKHCCLNKRLLEKKLRAPFLFTKKAGGPFSLAAWKTFTPVLGEIVWEVDPWSTFHSYICKDEKGRRIGYIRLSSYDGDHYDANEFASLIDRMQEKTDALVIDQIDNPGGSVFYLYALASMLSDKPLSTPRHHYKITQADVAEAVEAIPQLEEIQCDDDATSLLGDSVGGYPVNFQLIKSVLSYYRFMLDQWSVGRTFTEPFHLLGVDKINVNSRHRYTKPILLLVNELDFSGADFLPAILQDNKRALILGTKTAGAGGLVIQNRYPSLFGIEGYTYTASIAERPNGDPIENLGVTPDIIYQLTPDDIQFGFQGYLNAINLAIDSFFTH